VSAPEIYRWEGAAPSPGEGIMRFRLFYEGQLFSAKEDWFEADGSPKPDMRVDHKHEIRRHFHRQLKHLWEENRFLSTHTSEGTIMGLPAGERRPLAEVVREAMGKLGNFEFVPLVCSKFDLLCRIDVLMLRRDRPGGIFLSPRDIDNRLKILFDALKKPRQLGELGSNVPREGETPLYTLVEADELISHVSVETDTLLDPPHVAGKDDSFVRLILTVTLAPYNVNMFNLGFAGA
jgi:hypothetical protein